ncbi:hypothetical protein BC936DRAFT_148143 [Jimgerdemannia flammicorona]|uniref:Uncharacterized protein n=1 Tax=Jimgerdemannia flammicorona TaxID=994334 RepID=A0A433DKP6_9FUNG|nr:hypothetical protein BC936DRAFT_148143 [Jimgerdemannia flammicorona]
MPGAMENLIARKKLKIGPLTSTLPLHQDMYYPTSSRHSFPTAYVSCPAFLLHQSSVNHDLRQDQQGQNASIVRRPIHHSPTTSQRTFGFGRVLLVAVVGCLRRRAVDVLALGAAYRIVIAKIRRLVINIRRFVQSARANMYRRPGSSTCRSCGRCRF